MCKYNSLGVLFRSGITVFMVESAYISINIKIESLNNTGVIDLKNYLSRKRTYQPKNRFETSINVIHTPNNRTGIFIIGKDDINLEVASGFCK